MGGGGDSTCIDITLFNTRSLEKKNMFLKQISRSDYGISLSQIFQRGEGYLFNLVENFPFL